MNTARMRIKTGYASQRGGFYIENVLERQLRRCVEVRLVTFNGGINFFLQEAFHLRMRAKECMYKKNHVMPREKSMTVYTL